MVVGFLEGHAEEGVEVVRGKKLEVARQGLAMVVCVPTWQVCWLGGVAWAHVELALMVERRTSSSSISRGVAELDRVW